MHGTHSMLPAEVWKQKHDDIQNERPLYTIDHETHTMAKAAATAAY